MQLSDVEWGDVVVDDGEVMVCEGSVDGDAVLVKRWAGGVLDAEQQARRALVEQPGPQLVGWGDGWLAVEDIRETIWRPARPADLEDRSLLEAWGRRLAAIHAVGLPEDLPSAAEEALLAPDVVEVVSAGLPEVGDHVVDRVGSWRARVQAAGECLLIGGFAVAGLAVRGDAGDACWTDLSAAHRGAPAEDVSRVLRTLAADDGPAFLGGYRQVAPADATCDEVLAAARGLLLWYDLVGRALSGRVPQQLIDDLARHLDHP